MNYIKVTPANVSDYGIFCIKDKKSIGYKKKVAWFKNKLNSGLEIIIAVNEENKQVGFIEYIPSELAWRPINAKNYLFIQCIALFTKNARNKSVGSKLIELCEADGKLLNKNGICTMTSNGPWMANSSIFIRQGYHIADQKGRFELLSKPFRKTASEPIFNDWEKEQKRYKGWHLVYSDQCPWHEKAIIALHSTAIDHNIDLNITKIKTAIEAQYAPSGFGTFTLIRNGNVLADHYISKTRFENIIRKN